MARKCTRECYSLPIDEVIIMLTCDLFYTVLYHYFFLLCDDGHVAITKMVSLIY